MGILQTNGNKRESSDEKTMQQHNKTYRSTVGLKDETSNNRYFSSFPQSNQHNSSRTNNSRSDSHLQNNTQITQQPILQDQFNDIQLPNENVHHQRSSEYLPQPVQGFPQTLPQPLLHQPKYQTSYDPSVHQQQNEQYWQLQQQFQQLNQYYQQLQQDPHQKYLEQLYNYQQQHQFPQQPQMLPQPYQIELDQQSVLRSAAAASVIASRQQSQDYDNSPQYSFVNNSLPTNEFSSLGLSQPPLVQHFEQNDCVSQMGPQQNTNQNLTQSPRFCNEYFEKNQLEAQNNSESTSSSLSVNQKQQRQQQLQQANLFDGNPKSILNSFQATNCKGCQMNQQVFFEDKSSPQKQSNKTEERQKVYLEESSFYFQPSFPKVINSLDFKLSSPKHTNPHTQ